MAAARMQQLGWAVCWASFAVVILSAQPADWDRLVREGDAALANRDFATATDLFESAVAVGETFPDNDPRRPRALMRLARVHRADGDLASPEDIYRQADRAALAAWGRESV